MSKKLTGSYAVEEKVYNHPFRTQFNHHRWPTDHERNDMPSETIPNQAMSIEEIMRRFASGLPLGGAKVPIYDGEDDDMPDLSRMDKIERIEAIRSLTQEHIELTDKINTDAIKRKALKERSGSRHQDTQDTVITDRMGGDLLDQDNPQYPKKTPAERPRRAAGGKQQPDQGADSTNNP